ncbi:MAG: hypothetical protein ACREQQ_13690, partial [Candidatus Binatia bacterium]
EMGIAATGIWRVNSAMASRFPVLSKFVQTQDGRRLLPKDLTAAELEQVRDYGLIQYDVLFGQQYALRDVPRGVSSPPATDE